MIISVFKIKIKGTVYLGKLRYFINEDVLLLFFFGIKHMISRPKALFRTIRPKKTILVRQNLPFRQITLSFHNLAKALIT